MSGSMTEKKRCHCNRCGGETWQWLRARFAAHDEDEVSADPYDPDPYQVSWDCSHSLLECWGCMEVTYPRACALSEWDPGEDQRDCFPLRTGRRDPAWFQKLPADSRALLEEVYTAMQAASAGLNGGASRCGHSVLATADRWTSGSRGRDREAKSQRRSGNHAFLQTPWTLIRNHQDQLHPFGISYVF